MSSIIYSFEGALDWILQSNAEVEHVSLHTFAKRYSFFDRASTEQAYERIPKNRREKLSTDYEFFMKNRAAIFWTERGLKMKTAISAKRAASDVLDTGVEEARRAQQKRRITLANDEDEIEETLEFTGEGSKQVSHRVGPSAPSLFPHEPNGDGDLVTTPVVDSSPAVISATNSDGDDNYDDDAFGLDQDIESEDEAELSRILYSPDHEAPTTATSSQTAASLLEFYAQHATCSRSKLDRRIKPFEQLDRSRFWRLRSDRAVEDVLFMASLQEDATVGIRSCAIDFDCETTRRLFTDEEWQELQERNNFRLPGLPATTVDYLVNVRKAMMADEHVSTVALPVPDRFSCELAMITFMKWTRLYKKTPSPFTIKSLSEAYWARTSWPLMKDLLDDTFGVLMVDGEKAGIDSTRRRNRHRTEEDASVRRRIGRKLDLVGRNFIRNEDWMIIESMNSWDPTSPKFLTDNVDLFRELHTIMAHRLKQAWDHDFRGEARFFGVYAGDKGFRTIEMRAAGSSTYVTFCKVYKVYCLPPTLDDLTLQFQSLAHLLQVRACVTQTMASYEKILSDRADRDDDNGWLYENDSVDLYDETLASSPICSP
ncbi:hypothetical protein BGZ65_003799 [Modicella reniformis]|uniref:Uncharacterized protein n=1 Tax=Modicella reniformis TaxID=1440133 RepID=A0A9P6LT98_9FUNG|nr:hypothetical protein BGZ65_003799 [Modicella reniformis]